MDIMTLLVAAGLLATLTALGLGMGSMAHGGEFDRAHSTQYMFARVGSQAVTLLLLIGVSLAA